MKAFRALVYPIVLAAGITTANAQDDGLNVEDLFADDFEQDLATSINDPFEGVNRAIFKFNNGVYKNLFRPFARAYTKIVPDPIEKGIGNVFNNLKLPSRFVSNAFQGRFGQAGKETGQFVINTTAGIGGIFRVSDRFEDLQTSQEDFGQTLGAWGFGHGFYIIVPFLGPTSLRDFAADFVDDAVDPIPTPNSQIDDSADRLALRVIDIVNRLPSLIDLYDSMSRSAIDPYASMRDGYTQRRASQVAE